MSGPAAPCLSASAKNCTASSSSTSPLKATSEVRDSKAVEDGKQQQRIFRRLSERLGLFDEEMRALDRGPGFGRGVTANVQERGDELVLKLDFLAAQVGRARQGRDHVERAFELLLRLDQSRTLRGALSGFPPQRRGFLVMSRLGAVTRHDLGLVLGDLAELLLEGLSDSSMKLASWRPQQRPYAASCTSARLNR